MARYYADKINFDLSRINEVPSYYRAATIAYINSHNA